jgi:hypothetical protein
MHVGSNQSKSFELEFRLTLVLRILSINLNCSSRFSPRAKANKFRASFGILTDLRRCGRCGGVDTDTQSRPTHSLEQGSSRAPLCKTNDTDFGTLPTHCQFGQVLGGTLSPQLSASACVVLSGNRLGHVSLVRLPAWRLKRGLSMHFT